MSKKILISFLMILSVVAISCRKKTTTSATADPRVPPGLTFKSGGIYTSKDSTVGRNVTLTFGVKATKTEDNLSSLNGSYAFDGATTTTSFYNHQMFSSEYNAFSADVQYTTRNQAGTETVTFSVVDRDGNITKKIIVLTIP